MTETKYGKYVYEVPIGAEEIIKAFPKSAEQREPPPDMKNMDLSKVPPTLNFVGSQAFGLNLGMIMIPVSAPIKMESKPHSHDFDQLLCFLGTNPKNLKEFGAEIEFHFGGRRGKAFNYYTDNCLSQKRSNSLSPQLFEGRKNGLSSGYLPCR